MRAESTACRLERRWRSMEGVRYTEIRLEKMGLVVSCREGLGRWGLSMEESTLPSKRRSGLLRWGCIWEVVRGKGGWYMDG